MMTLIVLAIPIITIPVGLVIISIDLLRHELSRFSIPAKVVIIGTLIEAAGLILLAAYLLDKLRGLRTW